MSGTRITEYDEARLAELEKRITNKEKLVRTKSDEIKNIVKILRKRNKTLAKAVYLKMAHLGLFSDVSYAPQQFVPKRGRRHKGIQIQEAKYVLRLRSDRTAQDYVRFFQAIQLINDFYSLLEKLSALKNEKRLHQKWAHQRKKKE